MKAHWMLVGFATVLIALSMPVQGQWQEIPLINPGVCDGNLFDIKWADSLHGLIIYDCVVEDTVSSNFLFYLTKDGGHTWELDSLTPKPRTGVRLSDAFFSTSKTIIFAFQDGPSSHRRLDTLIQYTVDGGATWKQETIKKPDMPYSSYVHTAILKALDSTTLLLFQQRASNNINGIIEPVHVSTDLGTTWSLLGCDTTGRPGINNNFIDFVPIKTAVFFKFYEFDEVDTFEWYSYKRYSNDSGTSWSALDSQTNHALKEFEWPICGFSPIVKFVRRINDTGIIAYHSTDGAYICRDTRYPELPEAWIIKKGYSKIAYDDGLLIYVSDEYLNIDNYRTGIPIHKAWNVDSKNVYQLYTYYDRKLYARRGWSTPVVLDLATLATENPPAPQAHQLAVYPNPVSLRENEFLSISLPETNARYSLSVYDNLGRMVYMANREEGHGSASYSVRIRDAFAASGPGLYYVRVQSAKGVFTGKVMVY